MYNNHFGFFHLKDMGSSATQVIGLQLSFWLKYKDIKRKDNVLFEFVSPFPNKGFGMY